MEKIAMAPRGASKCPNFIATADADAVTADGGSTSSTPTTADISVLERNFTPIFGTLYLLY
jgi:hypothetical protein